MLKRNQWLLQFLSAGILLVVASARVIKDVTNETPSAEGTCFYNGTWYDEGTELPTRGLCLICHCFEGFTEPNAFTCSVIDCPWEDYHQRFPGCTPIYADRDCCPIGWECDQRVSKDTECDCEWRYLKHYEAKGCRPVYEEKKPWRENRAKGKPKECPCPWRFDCSMTDDESIEERACIYKKQVYPIGSKINITNPCESCSCVADYFTQAPTISCLTVECPTVYSKTPLPEGCHYVYTEGQCCPVAAECPSVQERTLYNVPICEYKGKMYYEGEQIYPDEDPCLICLCTPHWTGVNSSSCRQHDCMLERDSRKLKQGCIPIYHEKTCCPIDYHCADEDFGFPRHPNRGPSFKSEDDEDEMCAFEGRYYPIGHVLDIKHPTNCVTCTCKTPPDFTCIHSSCPPPPNNDYTNCKAVYKPHSCCPDYACEQKSNMVCPEPICHGTNCWLVKREEDGCSICRCKSRCLPCPDMCQPENPDNECSGCICQINSTALASMEEMSTEVDELKVEEGISKNILIEKCSELQCLPGEKCVLTKEKCTKEECKLKATCEKIILGCVRKTCSSDCEEIGRYEDSCPICHCKDKTKDPDYEVKCSNPFCDSNCIFEGRNQENCPICHCPSGSSNKSCSPNTCRGYNCSLSVNDAGCIDCTCQLPCKPRECPSGCDLDLDAMDGDGLTCGCRCKNATGALELIYSKPINENCPAITCRGYNCTVSSDDSSCPTCSCKEDCEIPKCLDGCRLENDTTEGRCPTCVCKLSRSARDNTQKECPPPTCLGYNCSVITGDNGCQQCLCESPCEEQPQCPSHCKLESTAPEGRCRACICSENSEKDEDNLQSPTLPPKPTNGGIPGENVEPEKRENWDADFIPLPNKEIVPEVDNIYLLKDKDNKPENVGDGHAYPIFGEKLESGFYMAEDSLLDTGSDLTDIDGDNSELKGFGDDYMEEKGLDEDDKCKFKNCPPGQKCMTRRLQCIRSPCPTIPVCIDVEPRCPIPSCAIGCMVMKWDDEVCPSCFCGIIRGAQGKMCPRVPCSGERCYNVIDDDGCPKCKCDSICITPECPEGCWLETETSDGQCPKCNCPKRRTTTTISSASFGTTTTTESSMSSTTESQISTTIASPTTDSESNTDLSSLEEISTLPRVEDIVAYRSELPSFTTSEATTEHVTTTEPTNTDTVPSQISTKQMFHTSTPMPESTPEHISAYTLENTDDRTTVTVNLPTTTIVSITEIYQTEKSKFDQITDESVNELSPSVSDSGFPEFPHFRESATTREPSFVRKPPQLPPRVRKPSPQATGVRTTTGTHSAIVSFYDIKNLTKLTVNLQNTKPTPKPCNRKITTVGSDFLESNVVGSTTKSNNFEKQELGIEKVNDFYQKITTEPTPTTKTILQSTPSFQEAGLNISGHTNVNTKPFSQPKDTHEQHFGSIRDSSPQMLAGHQQNSAIISTQAQGHVAPISNFEPEILDIVSALHLSDLTHTQQPTPLQSQQMTNNHQPSSFQTPQQSSYQNHAQNEKIQSHNSDQGNPLQFQIAHPNVSTSDQSSNQQLHKPLHTSTHGEMTSSHIFQSNSQSASQVVHQNAQSQVNLPSVLTSQESNLNSKDSQQVQNNPDTKLHEFHNLQSHHTLPTNQNNVSVLQQEQPTSLLQQSSNVPSNKLQHPSPVITMFNQHQPSLISAYQPQILQANYANTMASSESMQLPPYQQANSQHHSTSNIYQTSNTSPQQLPHAQQQNDYNSLPSQPNHSVYQPPLIISPEKQHMHHQYPQINLQNQNGQVLPSQNMQSHQQQFSQSISLSHINSPAHSYNPTINQQISQPHVSIVSQSSSSTGPIASPSTPHHTGIITETNNYQSSSSHQPPQIHHDQQLPQHPAISLQTSSHHASTFYQPTQLQDKQQVHHFQAYPQHNRDQWLQQNLQNQQQASQFQSHQAAAVIQADSHQISPYQKPLLVQNHQQQSPQHQDQLLQNQHHQQQQQLQLQQQQEKLKLKQKQQEQQLQLQQQQEQLKMKQQQDQQLQLQEQQEQLKMKQQQEQQLQHDQKHQFSEPQHQQINTQNLHATSIHDLPASTLTANVLSSSVSQSAQAPHVPLLPQVNQATQLNVQQQTSFVPQGPQVSLFPQLQTPIVIPYQHQQMLNSRPIHQTISQLQQDLSQPSMHSSNTAAQQDSQYKPPIQTYLRLPQNGQGVYNQASDSSVYPNIPSETSQLQNHHQMPQTFGTQHVQSAHKIDQANSAYQSMEQQHVFNVQNIQASPYSSQQLYQQPNYGPEIMQFGNAHVFETYQGPRPIISQQIPSIHQQYVPSVQHAQQSINLQHQNSHPSMLQTHHQVNSNQQSEPKAPNQSSEEQSELYRRPINTQTALNPQQTMNTSLENHQSQAQYPQRQELKPFPQQPTLQSTKPNKHPINPMHTLQQSSQTKRPTYVQSYVIYTDEEKPVDHVAEIQSNDDLAIEKTNIPKETFSQSQSEQTEGIGTLQEQSGIVPEHILNTEDTEQVESSTEYSTHIQNELMIEQVSSEPVIEETPETESQNIPVIGIKGRPNAQDIHLHPFLKPTENIKPPINKQNIIAQVEESDSQQKVSDAEVQHSKKATEAEDYQESNVESASQSYIHQEESQNSEDYLLQAALSNDKVAAQDEASVYYYDDDVQNSHNQENKDYEDEDPSSYDQHIYASEYPTVPSTTTTTTSKTTTEKRKTIRFTFTKRSPKPTQAMSQTSPATSVASTTPAPTKRPESQFAHQWFLNYQRDRTSTTLHPALQQHYQQHQHQHQQQLKPSVEFHEHIGHQTTSSQAPSVSQHTLTKPQLLKPEYQPQNSQYHIFHSSQNHTQLTQHLHVLDDNSQHATDKHSTNQQQQIVSADIAVNKYSSIPPIYLPTVSAADQYGVKKSSPDPHDSAYPCPTPHCNGYNCSLLRGSDGCQKCVCDSPCSPCPQYCVKTKTLADGRCPICDCTGPGPQKPIILASADRCSPIECQGQNCRQVKDASGCPTCICDPQCVTPKCDPGCEILRDVPAGQCPGCVCKVTVVQAVVKKRPCSIVSCSSPNCKEILDNDGCAKCECGPACPPPKCDPGCSIQSGVAAGQCPTCVCSEYADDDEEEDGAYCPNLFCADYGCREIPGPAGCPICLCDPLCKTPVCEPGCEIVTNKYLGRCPVCICRSPNEAISSNKNLTKFSPEDPSDHEPVNLQEEDSKYTTVSLLDVQEQQQHYNKKQPQHHQQEVQQPFPQHPLELSGQQILFDDITTEEPTTTEPTTPRPTCPSPLCDGLRCQTIRDSNGCQICTCKYPCPTPKCVGNCYAETNYPSHRCPGCVCPSRRKPSSAYY